MSEAAAVTYELWAKTEPFHPLWCHLIDIGNVTRALLETPAFTTTVQGFRESSNYPDSLMPAWLGYLTALHDIGKCHHDFQGKGPEELVRPREERLLRIKPPASVLPADGFQDLAL